MIETKQILKKVVHSIVRDINSRGSKQYLILGVDLVGALLASRVAFSLQMPLSYVIPTREERHSADQEIELDYNNKEDIIMITDAVVTMSTLQEVISKYGLQNKISSVYTILYREPMDDDVIVDYALLDKIRSVNNEFPIEVIERDKCVYRQKKCHAINQRIHDVF